MLKRLLLIIGFAVLPLLANAAAFQLWEQNASGLGDYHAGGAAEAADASTAYYNPAGMSLINKQEMVLGAVLVKTRVKYIGSVDPDSADPLVGVAHGGVFAPIPFFHYVSPVNDKWHVGLSIVAPFGLATKFGPDDTTRNYTTRTQVRNIDLSPVVSYAINSKWSIGAGLDYEKLEGDFDSFFQGENDDENHASGWGTGWHGGVLYHYSKETRIGLAYHSQVRFHLKGTGKIIWLHFPNEQNDISANVTLPAFTQLSLFHQLTKRYSLLASVTHTQWQVFQDLTLRDLPNINGGDPMTVYIPQHFHNSWNIALGLHYQASKRCLMRFGVGYDQTPSINEWRNIRLPDQSRIALALGAGYQATKQLKLDFGYSHLFVKRAEIDNTVEIVERLETKGHAISSADLLGVQATWDFA